MDVNQYMKHQFDNCINEIEKQEQITYSPDGMYISTLGLLALFRKGYYSEQLEPLQRSVHKMLTGSNVTQEVRGNCFHQSLALMYSEN